MKKNKLVFLLISIIAVSLIAIIAANMLMSKPKIAESKTADTSLLDIRKKGKLVVGVDIPYGVMEFYDESGKPVGIDIDIANAIASGINVAMEFKTMPFDKLFDSLKNREVDLVISAVTITPERQKEMLFSVPYLDAGMSIAVRKDYAAIKSLDDLKGKSVGVLKGTVGEDLASKSEYIDASLIRSYQTNDERIQDLLNGKLDAAIVHFLVKDLPSIKFVGEPLSHSYYGVVARLNNSALMDEINRILREMKRNGKLKEIKQHYTAET